jgi:hypothetical protein
MSSAYGRRKQTIDEKAMSSPEYAEVRETFRRVNSVNRGSIDA